MIVSSIFFFFFFFFFLIFSKFWFSGSIGGWKVKKWSIMTKNSVCCTPYLRNHTWYDCDFCYTCVKWWYLQQIFSFLKILIFGVFKGQKDKKWPKLPISICFALYLRNCRSYHQDFENDIYKCFSLYFFKKCNIVNVKIILCLLAHFNSFFNNNLFFKFINKCQQEILRYAPPSSRVCDFLLFKLK